MGRLEDGSTRDEMRLGCVEEGGTGDGVKVATTERQAWWCKGDKRGGGV